MADIKREAPPPAGGDDDVRQGIELLFYAYRDFTRDADAILARYGFGRAHHRVIHFVGRYPGIVVADLLGILSITKQSLARVLKQLIDRGFIRQEKGQADGRQRHLHLTPEGAALERELSKPQRARVGRTYARAGREAVAGFREVLLDLIDEDDRATIFERVTK